MKERACNFSIIRFLPYRETGEFVNVGIVLSCPEIGYLDFKIAPRRLPRARRFFPELDQQIMVAGVRAMEAMLISHRNCGELFTEGSPLNPAAMLRGVEEFRWLLRRRETLLHFADPGAVISADPYKTLIELYDRFVNRAFAMVPEYQEKVMQRRLSAWLKDWNLDKAYKRNVRVGTDYFHTQLPFVHREKKLPIKAIKPLDLNRTETTRIYEHGDTWVQKMKRLAQTDAMPTEMIFTVALPAQTPSKNAADEIVDALKNISHVVVIPFEEKFRLHQLATL